VLAHASLRPHDFVPRTEQASVARMFRAEFPNTPVFAALGNNDSDKDHDLQSADFLAAWSKSWSQLLKAGPAKDNFKQHFPAHGWFAVDIPGMADFRLLVLNSSSFDRRSAGSVADAEAKAQLNWLTGEIDKAGREKKRLWLAFHMPPGLDPFDPVGKTAYWSADAQSNFLAVVATHADMVTAIFCGHTHRDEFRIICNGVVPAAFVHITPSLSPCYLNNPAYQVFDVETTSGKILDCRTYYLPFFANGPAWSLEYSFATTFAGPAYDLPSLLSVQAQLRRGEKVDLFREFYGVSNVAGQIPALDDFGGYLDKTTISTTAHSP
jgi:sphingomyelin phosphodiesterase acid-like 3